MTPNRTSTSILRSKDAEIVLAYTPQGYIFPDEPSAGDIVIGQDEVLRSAAGYYVGQMCFEYMSFDDVNYEWFHQPWSRESGYFETHQEALLNLTGEDQ